MDKDNGRYGVILFAGDDRTSGPMEKVVADSAVRNGGNAERAQQKAEAFVFARRGFSDPRIECRAKGLVYLALDRNANGPAV